MSDEALNKKRFRRGCLGALLLIGLFVGLAFKLHASKKEAAKRLDEQLFTPYWTAIRQQDYEKARGFTTDAFLARYQPEDYEKTYQAMKSKYGELGDPELRDLTPMRVPGQEGQRVAVKVRFHFGEKRLVLVTYEIVRPDKDSDWKIELCRTPDREAEPGPW
ncbi:MAG: hypothetical protein KC910_11345 [Candidatus Eremiobacteraeota bacterium]|nr:hypothetical protein [Candidatus Eremiobacteraeota bacterium]